ncbi:MAG TPA: hypothetical protein VFQ61_19685, partial [Polyangiaceae bacterium]|nr:hypothetical protein [Polyangiaceae bacterium]
LEPAPTAATAWRADWSEEQSASEFVAAGQPANAQDLVPPSELEVEFSPQPAAVTNDLAAGQDLSAVQPTAHEGVSALPSTAVVEETARYVPLEGSSLESDQSSPREDLVTTESLPKLAPVESRGELTSDAGFSSDPIVSEAAPPEPLLDRPEPLPATTESLERTEPLPARAESLASPSEKTATAAGVESHDATVFASSSELAPPAKPAVSLDLERDIDWEEAGRVSKPFGAFPQVPVSSSLPDSRAASSNLQARGADAGAETSRTEPTSGAAEIAPISSIRSKPPGPEERRSQLPRARTPRGERAARSDHSERVPQATLRRPRSLAAPAREPAESVAAKTPPAPPRASLAQSARLLAALALGVCIGFGLGQLVARKSADKQLSPGAPAPALDIRSIQGESESNPAPVPVPPAPVPGQPNEGVPAEAQAAVPRASDPSGMLEPQPVPDSEAAAVDEGRGVNRAMEASPSEARRSAVLPAGPAGRQPSVNLPPRGPKKGEPSSLPAAAPAPGVIEPEVSEGKQLETEAAEAGSAASAAKLLAARAPFDPKLANSALAKAASAFGACVKSGESGGVAVVTVTFSPSGKVSLTQVAGSRFAGTPAADCISAAARNAQIPPFLGKPVSVKKSFVVE